ncbi:MAG: MFS transporter, partial [Syntrophomonadaceae bacterium]|nr:MFS transporter [Syntrophomonadaceae bacterium]
LFLFSQNISLLGSYLVQYAIMWHITLTTQSGIMMTIAIICGFLPTFFISPFAGVWADRYNRKTLIILSDSFIALSTLILAILFLLGYDDLWLLFAISAIRAIGSGIQVPAIGAIIPQIVPEDKLTKVNATNTSLQALIGLVSPVLSGALLSITAIEAIFFIDVITATIAVMTLLLLLQVPIHKKAAEAHQTGYFIDLRKGLKYINDHKYIRNFFVFCGFFFFFVAPAAFLTPLQVARSFGSDIWRLTAIEVAYSVGMMLGGILIAWWGGFRNKVHTMTLSLVIFGVCTLALGVVPYFSVYLIFLGISGISLPLFTTPSTVMLQEKVEEDYLGRVFGIFGMISSTMMPLGMLIFGPIADIIRIEWLLIGTGLLLFIQGLLLLGNKALIEAGRPTQQHEP